MIKRILILGSAGLLASGCMLTPAGTSEHQDRLDGAGAPYQEPFAQRTLPEVPSPASWQDVLHRAFLANGELESAYHQWRASAQRIGIASYWPNASVMFGFEYMFSRESMKAWDRTTISAGFDPAISLKLPSKVKKSGEAALEEARAAGHRFETAKFNLQRRVLSAYLDLVLTEEKIRIQQENLFLLKLMWDTAASRVQAGAPQQDLLKAQIQYQSAENALRTLESDAKALRASLNSMMARDPHAPLILPGGLPQARQVASDDAALIALGVDRNPELAELARQVAGQEDAMELAKMMYLPDFSPSASITGSVSRSVGAMLMLPTNLPVIRREIDAARAMLQAMESARRQLAHDRAGEFVATLYAMRNAERQAAVSEKQILPSAQQALASSRQAYSTGAIGFDELLESQRMLLEVRTMIAESRIGREKFLAELEALAGVDIETLETSQAIATASAKSASGGTNHD